jgi:uncharacterized membrane protein
MRRYAGWFFFATVVGSAAFVIILSILLGRYSPVGYPSFLFFGWWIFIPLFFFGFFFFFRWCGWGWWYPKGYYHSHDQALETLRERFARGEISKEQYDQIRADLERTR